MLIGSDKGILLIGSAGNDALDGRGGGHRYEAGTGDDVMRVRDGVPERVECGAGTDTVTADDIDEADECEHLDRSPELQTDVDGDGTARPADCDDAVHPGAVEVPDNGIDDDRVGGELTDFDRDRDGSARPFDCDDTSGSVRPGATEVRGNRVDEDCNGRADPFDRTLSGVPNN